jgi:NifB/MoaA-like Fe-S oxidoreductase
MFAPVLRGQIEKLNALIGSRIKVIAVPNTYFGGDVSVAGLLSGQDFLAVKDKIEGDFVVVPKHAVKSDEPILIDGMRFEDLKAQFDVPVYALDLEDLMKMFLKTA